MPCHKCSIFPEIATLVLVALSNRSHRCHQCDEQKNNRLFHFFVVLRFIKNDSTFYGEKHRKVNYGSRKSVLDEFPGHHKLYFPYQYSLE